MWLAKRRGFQGERVAIKVSQQFEAREVENLVAITQLSHPNLVKFVDFVEQQSALVMEYIEGISLRDHLKKDAGGSQQLGWIEVKTIMRGILSGLACLHTMDRAMSHRDVKPDNVMIANTARGDRDSDNIVLIDFGLSKRADAGQTITKSETFTGVSTVFQS